MSTVTIGLIGTGKIGSAVMTGFCSEGGWQPAHVYISPRNKQKAEALVAKFPDRVTIAGNNQEIIDKSDVIFVGLLPDVARKEIPSLTIPKEKKIISMMATIPYDELVKLVNIPSENVVRTVPLPSSSKRTGPILAYPKNEYVRELLAHVGTPVMVEKESEITTMTGITAMISFFYATCGTLDQWCVQNGVDSASSRAFVSSFFKSLSQAGVDSSEPFAEMAEEAATPGGLNEQTHRSLTETGAYSLMADQLDAIFTRLTGKDPAERPAKKAKHA